jgi:hypothetical protein
MLKRGFHCEEVEKGVHPQTLIFMKITEAQKRGYFAFGGSQPVIWLMPVCCQGTGEIPWL